MTIACLLLNTLLAACRRRGLRSDVLSPKTNQRAGCLTFYHIALFGGSEALSERLRAINRPTSRQRPLLEGGPGRNRRRAGRSMSLFATLLCAEQGELFRRFPPWG